MNSPRYDEIVELVRQSNGEGAGAGAEEAADERRRWRRAARRRDRAERVGHDPRRGDHRGRALLVASGAVEASYVDAMHEREQSVSTHMGNLLAIPHGTNEAKSAIRRTGDLVRALPRRGIDWNGKPAEFVVGIAGAGNDHLALLQKLAGVFVDAEQVEKLRAAQSVEEVRGILDGVRA